MTRCLAIILFAPALFAQNGADPFNRPPAAVDKALRERITEFFQDHVTGQFRQAEELVAEDTKDYFYDNNKPRYLSFEISRIDYSENFTRAKAIVLCEQNVVMPGFGAVLKIPTPTTWKLENGKWYWYVDQDALRDTPFGRVKNTSPADGKAAPSPLPPGTSLTSSDIALNRIRVDKDSLTLKAGEFGQITVSNTALGPMTVTCLKTQSFEATPELVVLKAGEKATVTVKALAGAPKTSSLYFRVEPSMEQLVVKVTVE
jgi:hypothetical protein